MKRGGSGERGEGCVHEPFRQTLSRLGAPRMPQLGKQLDRPADGTYRIVIDVSSSLLDVVESVEGTYPSFRGHSRPHD